MQKADNALSETLELQNKVSDLLARRDLSARDRFRLRKIASDLNGIATALQFRDFKRFANSVGGEYTLEEIGAVLGGVSRERVRQIEASALKKLKHPKIIKNFYRYVRNDD